MFCLNLNDNFELIVEVGVGKLLLCNPLVLGAGCDQKVAEKVWLLKSQKQNKYLTCGVNTNDSRYATAPAVIENSNIDLTSSPRHKTMAQT